MINVVCGMVHMLMSMFACMMQIDSLQDRVPLGAVGNAGCGQICAVGHRTTAGLVDAPIPLLSLCLLGAGSMLLGRKFIAGISAMSEALKV